VFSAALLLGHTIGTVMDVSASPFGTYFVTTTDFSGNESAPSTVASTATDSGTLPQQYVLSIANHPNPFNPRTIVRYTVPRAGAVAVAIFDARGQLVRSLLDASEHSAGAHELSWDGRFEDGNPAPSGVYHARIEAGGGRRAHKMLLVK
jgi:hypothetical protein